MILTVILIEIVSNYQSVEAGIFFAYWSFNVIYSGQYHYYFARNTIQDSWLNFDDIFNHKLLYEQ